MPSAARLDLSQARRLFLGCQALLGPPPPGGLPSLIHQLGFVQVDSISVVERAHLTILGSRLGHAPEGLEALLEAREIFEHWTHDASLIPTRWYPHWKPRFRRDGPRIRANAWWWTRVGENAEASLESVRTRIREEGPLRASDFQHEGPRGGGAWWGWKPQKAALEFLWRTGELAVARRLAFQKVYDLAERVFPDLHACPEPDPEAHLDWACRTALERLGTATHQEIAAFWNAVEPARVLAWCRARHGEGALDAVRVPSGEREVDAWALPDWEARLAALPEPSPAMVLLSPFDPILRDRKRALRLFGFDYRFEAFVPEAKRRFGYYAMPILEGEALVGRVDARFDRPRGLLEARAVHWEPGLRVTRTRERRLREALEQLARRIGAREGPRILQPAP
jgi:hypothetical protein